MARHLDLPNEAATRTFAAQLASQISAPMTVCLDGPLGAGKSVIARAMLQSLGVAGDIPSPTFTLVQAYEARGMEIWHMDAYRIEDEREAEELAILDAFDSALCLIEWPGKVASLLPDDRIDVFIHRIEGDEHARAVTLHGPLVDGLDFS